MRPPGARSSTSSVLEEVRALPGVRDAAYATGLPMAMRGGIWAVTLTGEEACAMTARTA